MCVCERERGDPRRPRVQGVWVDGARISPASPAGSVLKINLYQLNSNLRITGVIKDVVSLESRLESYTEGKEERA